MAEGDGEILVCGEADGGKGHGQEVAWGIDFVGVEGLRKAVQAVFEGVDFDVRISSPGDADSFSVLSAPAEGVFSLGEDVVHVCPSGLEALLGIKGKDEIGADGLVGFDGDDQVFIGEIIVFADASVGAGKKNVT